ncbi:hypothetical protein [Nocardioides montaniterrae]
MSLRRVLTALLALVTLVLGLAAVAGSAQAVTWTQVDKRCASNTSGQVCVATYTSSYGFRETVQLVPASGHWLKITSVASSQYNAGGLVCDDTYSGNGCPAKVTSAYTKTWTVQDGRTMVVSALVKSDTTQLTVAAGWSEWAKRGIKCTTFTQGKACVSVWAQARWNGIYFRSRGSLTPASGRTIAPEDTRIAIHYTVPPSTTVKYITKTTDFDGKARGSAWSAAGSALKLISNTSCDHLGGLFHYRAGGVVKALNLSTSAC